MTEMPTPGKSADRRRLTAACVFLRRFGNMQVLVTNDHLPYPFGCELTGYEVKDVTETLEKHEPPV
jgi:hypothetical protein